MDCRAVADHIVRWLDDYCATCGTKGFVVGISGGIDSALVSTLAAMTGRKTLCVTLPIHQAVSQVSRAEEHVTWLKERFHNVEADDVDLTDGYECFIGAFPDKTKAQPTTELTYANTRSRLRMTALYFFAGIEGLLVVGTGNKIEDFGVGFFTKYGDGGVDISPIADLTKSEVWELAAYLGVPESIIKAKPTDGLFGDDRSDEDQIGASYPELEWAMELYESGEDVSSLTGRQKEVYDIFVRRHKANKHKMQPIPCCKVPAEIK
ncbi:MAG: NAD(+) synthase [Tidjanibacter sp.]|nr:NAD(+) synthase [Tidjanibacter sp.]